MAATLHGAPGTHVQSHVVEEHARAHVHATTQHPEMVERHAQLVVLAMIRRLKLATNKAVDVSIIVWNVMLISRQWSFLFEDSYFNITESWFIVSASLFHQI